MCNKEQILLRILACLESQGKKQKDLAEFIGINKNNITDWKSGKSKSYMKYMPEIAEFLGVPINFLVKEEKRQNEPYFTRDVDFKQTQKISERRMPHENVAYHRKHRGNRCIRNTDYYSCKGVEKKMSLAKNIETMLESKGATQGELAEYCCVTQTMISKIMHGIRVPSIALTVRMADFFGCTVDELVK